MDLKSKKGKVILAISTFILMLLVLSPFIAGVFSVPSVSDVQIIDQVATAPGTQQSLGWKGDVYVTVKDQEGNVKYYYEGSNLLTDAGANALKSLIGDGSGTAVAYDYIAVGNGTVPATGSTTLDSEIAEAGLSRAQGSYTSLGTGHWKIEKVYSVTGTVEDVNSTALFNASSSGTMIAGDTFTDTNVANGDSLNISWDITLS